MFIDDEAEAWDGSDGQVDDDKQQDHGIVALYHTYSFRLIQRQNSHHLCNWNECTFVMNQKTYILPISSK